MPVKISKLPTNLNGKLDCEKFIHLDIAPKSGLPESILDNTVYEIRTDDNSHTPVKCKLADLLRIPLECVTTELTRQSHGINDVEFFELLIKKQGGVNVNFPGGIDPHLPMAVYFFEKITEEKVDYNYGKTG